MPEDEAGLPHLSRNVDLQSWLEHPDEPLRIAVEGLKAGDMRTGIALAPPWITRPTTS